MIYQIQIYYGALLNGQAVYSLEGSLEDCRNIPDEINEETLKKIIEQRIINDGLNPDNFEIGFLTKEQYENRFSPETEITTTWKVERDDSQLFK